MKKKSKIILGSSTVAGLALVGGVFALFSDEVSVDLDSKAGTVDVNATAELNHYQLTRDAMAILDYESNRPASFSTSENPTPEEVEEIRQEIKQYFEEAPDNVNPGDNDTIFYDDYETAPRPGTDHELTINIANEGTKSIATRVLVEITGTTTNNEPREVEEERPLTKEELSHFFVALDMFNTISGVTSIHSEYFPEEVLMPLLKISTDNENSITYGLSSDMLKSVDFNDISDEMPVAQKIPEILPAAFVFSGIGDNAEIEKYIAGYEQLPETYGYDPNDYDNPIIKECPTSGSFKLDLGMDEDAPNYLQGAKLKVNVKVQAIQYRNTNESSWSDVFEETFIIPA